MATTSDIKKGMCILYKHDTYKIIDFQHVKPGKGPAFVRTKLKSLTLGKVIDNTFSAGHKLDEVRVETRKYQFLYPDGDGEMYHFMNMDDYNQIQLPKVTIDGVDLLKEGEVVTVIVRASDEVPLAVDMPSSVILEVTHTEPGIKGNTATNATKPATVETGATINVPLFINEGDLIKIETEKGSYKERVKA